MDMPEVDNLINNGLRKANQLRRLLNRLAGPNAKPVEAQFASAEDNCDAIIEWFALQEEGLRNVFDPYLKNP